MFLKKDKPCILALYYTTFGNKATLNQNGNNHNHNSNNGNNHKNKNKNKTKTKNQNQNNHKNNIKLILYSMELSLTYWNLCDIKKLNEMRTCHITDLFGGVDRVKRLGIHFENILNKGCKIGLLSLIESKHLVGMESLKRINLLKYFKTRNSFICKYSKTDLLNLQKYASVNDNKELINTLNNSHNFRGDKCYQNKITINNNKIFELIIIKKLQQIKTNFNLNSNEILLIDANPNNINKVKNYCKTFQVRPKQGLMEHHLKKIETKIGIKYQLNKYYNSKLINNKIIDLRIINDKIYVMIKNEVKSMPFEKSIETLNVVKWIHENWQNYKFQDAFLEFAYKFKQICTAQVLCLYLYYILNIIIIICFFLIYLL